MTTPPRAPHPRNPLAVVAAPVQTMLSSLWHQPESRRGRAIRFSVIWIACLGLTVGLLFVIVGKANASCAASGSDPTCPVPAQFAGKFRAGYFTKAKGIPTGKVFNTPVKVHDLFINKYKNLYKNASDARKKNLYEYGLHLYNNSRLRMVAAHWTARSYIKAHPLKAGSNLRLIQRSTCLIPLSVDCLAGINWAKLSSDASCGGWHSWPNIFQQAACNRFLVPTSHQEGLTWDEVRNGLKIGACAVASGAAVVMAVGTRGAAAPGMAAMATSVGCGITLWEAVE
jgi:hypothetical protein